MLEDRFKQVIRTRDGLRDIVGEPSQLVLDKQFAVLDAHTRAFVALSPFALLATSDKAGRCDVSPRGDGAGFIHVLDNRTVIVPERRGNRRADSLLNIVENPQAGLLLLVPGYGETLRLNGRACIIADADVLEPLAMRGAVPQLGIAIEIEEVFFHCARAFKRSQLWEPESWVHSDALPSLAKILMDQINPQEYTQEDLETMMKDAYGRYLY